eukprot:m.20222 g.20222  ORF g.20222 m.20222 type:complete len:268 (+) comp8836_c0_seq1:133-936(+)
MSYGKADRYQGRDGDNEYLRLSRQIPQGIVTISKNTRALQKITGLIGTPREPRNSTAQIKTIINDTTTLMQMAKQQIEELGRLDGGNAADARNRRQEQHKYRQDLEAASRSFEMAVKQAVAREQDSLNRERAESMRQQGYGNNDAENMSLIEDDRRQELAMQQDMRMRTAFIQEREQGIKDLHSQMHQVHEIFQDVAELVQDQGQVLENIEAGMQVTYDRVDQGVVELTKASRYQKSARNKAMCLLVIVVIVAGVLAAILVPVLKKH